MSRGRVGDVSDEQARELLKRIAADPWDPDALRRYRRIVERRREDENPELNLQRLMDRRRERSLELLTLFLRGQRVQQLSHFPTRDRARWDPRILRLMERMDARANAIAREHNRSRIQGRPELVPSDSTLESLAGADRRTRETSRIANRTRVSWICADRHQGECDGKNLRNELCRCMCHDVARSGVPEIDVPLTREDLDPANDVPCAVCGDPTGVEGGVCMDCRRAALNQRLSRRGGIQGATRAETERLARLVGAPFPDSACPGCGLEGTGGQTCRDCGL